MHWFISGFFILCHWCTSLLMPTLCCFGYYSFVVCMYVCIWDGVSLCHPGWSAVAQSWLTAASASWVQVILLPQPFKVLRLQAWATVPGRVCLFFKCILIFLKTVCACLVWRHDECSQNELLNFSESNLKSSNSQLKVWCVCVCVCVCVCFNYKSISASFKAVNVSCSFRYTKYNN